mgnify:CR=1 FL=1
MSAQHNHRDYPKLHNAMWPGLVGKGGDGGEPPIDLDTMLELTAAAACVTYVERTQLGKRPPLSPPLRESAGVTLSIDAASE